MIDAISFGWGVLTGTFATITIAAIFIWLSDDDRCTNCGQKHNSESFWISGIRGGKR